jgi:archaellum component FlaC
MSYIVTMEEKRKYVRRFVDAYYGGAIRIVNFFALGKLLEHAEFKSLLHPKIIFGALREGQAQTYFNYLLSRAAESRHKESLAQSEEIIDQLYTCITAVQNDIEMREGSIWISEQDRRLESIEKRLETLTTTLQERDKQVTDILTKILAWMETYSPALDDAKKYFGDKRGGIVEQ